MFDIITFLTLWAFFEFTAPVVKIKQSLTKLKQEIVQMDIRIGVVEHTLLQAKLKEKSNMTRDMHATNIPEPAIGAYWDIHSMALSIISLLIHYACAMLLFTWYGTCYEKASSGLHPDYSQYTKVL